MKLLLDTHIAIWAVLDSPRLDRRAAAIITDAQDVFVSATSIIEVAVKRLRRSDQIELTALDAMKYMIAATYTLLPITADHAAAVEGLPPIHGDPFDRVIVAQALHEQLRLITHDRAVARYSDTFILV